MESAIKANNLKPGNAPLSGQYSAGDNALDAAPIKIKFALKAVVFCFSVVTLSWIFEGLRQCKGEATPQGLAYLLGGIVLTLLLVVMQGFFIYCEERSKGARTRKIALFDKWYLFLTSKQKGD